MKPHIAKRRLHARIFILRKLLKGLRQTANSLIKKKGSSSLTHILEHDRQMVETETEFLSSLIKKL